MHVSLPSGKACTTVEPKVNGVRAVTEQVGLVRAVGIVIHLGNRRATTEARLVGSDARPYAHACTTCFIFDAT